MLVHITSKSLANYWLNNDPSGIRPDWIRKVKRILGLLHQAKEPHDMAIAGYGFHALKGDRAGTYAVTVSRNWRITFRFRDGHVSDVDLEDYHGS